MEIRRRMAHASSWLLACCLLLLTTKCSKEDGPDLSAPQMTIGVAKNITRTSAEISGTISGGNLKAYEVGFMYSTAKSDLTTSVNSSASKVSASATSGSVTALLSKLQPNTVYYYCLYARSGKTQMLSEVGQFTTTALGKPELGTISIVAVDEYSFTLSCTVVADGGSNLQTMGFEYKLSHETAWLKSVLTAAFDEGSTNKFTVTIPDLEPETAYRVRAIATNKEGTGYSSEEGIEVVTKELSAPVVSTQNIAADNIGSDWVTVIGSITNKGGSDEITRRGFVYSTSKENPLADVDETILSDVEKDQFHATIKGLKPNTTYYLRAFASNVVDNQPKDGYGNTITFTTQQYTEPKFADVKVDSKTETSAVISFTLQQGSGSIIQTGICYSATNAKPDMEDEAVEAKEESNRYVVSLSDLQSDRSYYVRPYVICIGSDGKETTLYGDVLSFKTSAHTLPKIVNFMVGNVNQTSAKLMATFEKGTVTITEKGFCYINNLVAEPTIDNKKVSVDGTDFEVILSDLTPETNYACRAYISYQYEGNTSVVYSETETFTTSAYAAAKVSLPELSDISYTSAKATAVITSLGDGILKEKGFCWKSGSAMPSLTDANSKHVAVSSDDFSATITDLKSDNSYYIRAYVITEVNGKEMVSYSENNSFTTLQHTLPSFVDIAVDNVSQTSATLSATFDKGSVTITEKGFCYTTNTGSSPTITNKKVAVDGDNLSATLSDLKPETDYACRAYISYQYEGNSGVVYSEKETFTTGAYAAAEVTSPELADISYTSVKATAEITSLGDGTLKEKGFCWKSGSAMPSLTDANSKHVAVSSDDFSATITDLKSDNSYYIRAYVITEVNGKEMVSYSENNSFTTLQHTLPSFVDIAVDNVSQTSATLSATFDKGSVTITEKGFCYNNTGSTPTIANKKVTVDGDNLTATLSDLKPETNYTCRAYISYQYEGNSGVAYSDTQTFTTKSYVGAEVTSPELTDISYTSVKATAEITSLGDGTLKEKGFCWKSNYYTPSLTDADTKHIAVEGEDFSATITDLKAGYGYYIRAYVITEVNGKEIVTYSSNSSFSTLSQYLPEVAKVTAEAIETTSIQLKAYCYSKGTPQATEYGFVWSTTKGEAPAAMTNKQTVTLDDDNYLRLTLTGLASSTKYYIYAYAINAAGTVYSSEALEVNTKGGPNIDDNPSPGIN